MLNLFKKEIKRIYVPEYKIGDTLDLETEKGIIEKVTITKITPHPEVPNSVYYEFSNGSVCRDIRLK